MEGPEASLRRKLLLVHVPLREREEAGSPVLEESQTGFSSYYRNELALQRGRGIAGVMQEQEGACPLFLHPLPSLSKTEPGVLQKRGSPSPACPSLRHTTVGWDWG